MWGTQDKRNHWVIMFAKRKSYYFVSVSLSIISTTYPSFSFFFLIVYLSRYALIAFTLLSVGVSWVFLLESLVCGKDGGNGVLSLFRLFPLSFTLFLFFFFLYFTRVINWAMNKVVVSIGYSVMAYVGLRRCTIAINMGIGSFFFLFSFFF